jgi:hypothetical protein
LNKVPNPAHKLNEKGRRALHHHPSSRQWHRNHTKKWTRDWTELIFDG